MFVAALGASGARYPWEEYGKRLAGARQVGALDNEAFGDSVALQAGELGFAATDVAIPGNNPLTVAFTRRYAVTDRRHAVTDDMLADWSVDLPTISGTFASEWVGGGNDVATRCSDMSPPPVPLGDAAFPEKVYSLADFWNGLRIQLPGAEAGELLAAEAGIQAPEDGRSYRWVTNGQTHVACLPAIRNGAGEGFLAITADGTRYWFDWMAEHHAPDLRTLHQDNGGARYSQFLDRRRFALHATRVEDRHGNWVTYAYSNAWHQPARLTGMASSDGRSLSVAYGANGFIEKVVQGARTWRYFYATTPAGRTTLVRVVLPDASAWEVGFAAFTDAELRYLDYAPPGEPRRSCTVLELPQNIGDRPVGTLVHPAGAVGTFTVDIREHGRSNVPVNCTNVTTVAGQAPGTGNDPNDDANLVPISHYGFTLARRRVSGPGLATTEWTYEYVPGIEPYYYPGTNEQYPVCTVGAACYAAPCTSDACAGSSQTVVREAATGHWTRYTFGNSFRYNEGKLLKVERGDGELTTPALRTTEHAYDLTLADGPYRARWGRTLQVNGDGFAAEYHRPQLARTITQDGVAFRRHSAVADHDAFARPLRVTRSSSLGTRVDTTEYQYDLARWVIGQPRRMTEGGIETVRIEFDAASRPSKHFRFGKLQQTLAYNADGTVASIQDGRGYTTSLSSWRRGVPQSVTFPGSPARTWIVNDAGWATSVTDEMSARTCYAYDPLGRLASVTQPSETANGVCDASRWAPTTHAFERVGVPEFGLEPGHWRATVATGNARRVTYFDGLWRPVLEREYDAGDVAGTSRFIARAFDEEGRETFVSYPVAMATAIAGITQGTRTTFDPLGRRDLVLQDSELGLLATDHDHLPGFRVRVTNPRGHASTTSYLAYDEPSTEWPASIAHPEGAFTDIVRDPSGRVQSLSRRNADGTVRSTRRYVYGTSGGEPCKIIEPETGATVMAYDGAGNLAWSAAGLSLPAEDRCDLEAASVSGRRVTRGYDARNRLTTVAFPDGDGDQTWSYFHTGLPRQVITTNDGGTTSVTNRYVFNRRGLLTEESQSADYTWTVSYGYDANGHRTSLAYPAGLTLTLAVNALGQTTAITSGSRTYASGIGYHPNGALRRFTYGNGIVHSAALNARGLPERSEDRNGVVAVFDESYDYDGNGNVQAISDGRAGARSQRTMAYDGLDRLASAQSPMFGMATYGYDVLDNLAKVVAPGRNHAYWYDPATWRLTNVVDAASGASVVGLGYDAQGNLRNRNGAAFAFDIGNRLRNAAGAEAYRYDALGRRILATRTDGGRIHSLYARDGALLWQRDERAGRRLQYVYLAGRLIAQRSRPIGADLPETITYQHTDALGSPVAATNAGRTVVQTSEYAPYGKLLNRTPGDGPAYAGHVGDSSTGLVYMQQRYYDPELGRFISVDPVTADTASGGNFNRYWYANDNPYRYVDPDGRLGCTGTHIQRLCGAPGASGGPVGDVRPGSSAIDVGLARTFGAVGPYRNPTSGHVRGCDTYGCGRHGARRDGGRRRHDGADYVARPGQPVVSPTDGRVQRVSAPYRDDARYAGMLIRGADGNAVNLWYVAPDPGVVGGVVAAGQRIGVAQDLRAKYGAGMTNHVHVRIANPAGASIDPATLIPDP